MALLLITLVRVYNSGFLALQHSVSICDTLATSVTHLDWA